MTTETTEEILRELTGLVAHYLEDPIVSIERLVRSGVDREKAEEIIEDAEMQDYDGVRGLDLKNKWMKELGIKEMYNETS